jgi:hypothetical protein
MSIHRIPFPPPPGKNHSIHNATLHKSQTIPDSVDAADAHHSAEIVPIEPEIDQVARPDAILVANGGKLVVPREELASDVEVGLELDLGGLVPKVRKPNRREWIALNPASELTTRLLLYKPRPDAIEVEQYYVDPTLRPPIQDELKQVRVLVYWSFQTRTHALWIIGVTPDNTWYESQAALLKQPAEFFATNAIRVISDKPNSRYRIRYKPIPSAVVWPETSTNELLGEALGRDRFITSPEHPIYRDLIDGVEIQP